jgi:hypothetical protein
VHPRRLPQYRFDLPQLDAIAAQFDLTVQPPEKFERAIGAPPALVPRPIEAPPARHLREPRRRQRRLL